MTARWPHTHISESESSKYATSHTPWRPEGKWKLDDTASRRKMAVNDLQRPYDTPPITDLKHRHFLKQNVKFYISIASFELIEF